MTYLKCNPAANLAKCWFLQRTLMKMNPWILLATRLHTRHYLNCHEKCFDTWILLFDYSIKFHTRSPHRIMLHVCAMWCFDWSVVSMLSALLHWFCSILYDYLGSSKAIKVTVFKRIECTYLTITNAMTTRKQSTENWVQTCLHIICTYEVHKILRHGK